MNVVASIRTEYQRYRRTAELAIEQVDDAQFAMRVDAEANSIAVVVQHLAGNLRSRFTDFLTSDGEKAWRDRDAEFDTPTLERAALMRAWSEAFDVVEVALRSVEALGADGLTRTVTIRNQPLSVLDALLRSVAHLAYHTGQIVLLARTQLGPRWRTISIPRGGSKAYAANPTRERSPDGR